MNQLKEYVIDIENQLATITIMCKDFALFPTSFEKYVSLHIEVQEQEFREYEKSLESYYVYFISLYGVTKEGTKQFIREKYFFNKNNYVSYLVGQLKEESALSALIRLETVEAVSNRTYKKFSFVPKARAIKVELPNLGRLTKAPDFLDKHLVTYIQLFNVDSIYVYPTYLEKSFCPKAYRCSLGSENRIVSHYEIDYVFEQVSQGNKVSLQEVENFYENLKMDKLHEVANVCNTSYKNALSDTSVPQELRSAYAQESIQYFVEYMFERKSKEEMELDDYAFENINPKTLNYFLI